MVLSQESGVQLSVGVLMRGSQRSRLINPDYSGYDKAQVVKALRAHLRRMEKPPHASGLPTNLVKRAVELLEDHAPID